MSSILAFVLKFLSSGVIDKTLDYMKFKRSLENDVERMKTDIAIANIEASVAEMNRLTDFNESKLQNQMFWIFVLMFVGPLAFWWCAVILDSIFYFDWDVAALPPPLDMWAAKMVEWLFYTGSVVVGGKVLMRK